VVLDVGLKALIQNIIMKQCVMSRRGKQRINNTIDSNMYGQSKAIDTTFSQYDKYV